MSVPAQQFRPLWRAIPTNFSSEAGTSRAPQPERGCAAGRRTCSVHRQHQALSVRPTSTRASYRRQRARCGSLNVKSSVSADPAPAHLHAGKPRIQHQGPKPPAATRDPRHRHRGAFTPPPRPSPHRASPARPGWHVGTLRAYCMACQLTPDGVSAAPTNIRRHLGGVRASPGAPGRPTSATCFLDVRQPCPFLGRCWDQLRRPWIPPCCRGREPTRIIS